MEDSYCMTKISDKIEVLQLNLLRFESVPIKEVLYRLKDIIIYIFLNLFVITYEIIKIPY